MYSADSCADPDDYNYMGTINFLISQFIYLIAILSTFITSYLTCLVLTKSIFTVPTKLLIIQNLIYGNIHQLFYGIESIQLVYKNLFKMDKPCELLQSEASCSVYFQLLLAGTSGMIYGQTALMVERAFATFLKSYEKPKSYIIGGIISLVLFISSAFTGRLLIYNDPLKGYVIACFISPSQSFERITLYFKICSGLALFNLIMSIVIMRYNKKKEYDYRTRFKVKERFKKREVIDSTEAICFMALVELIFVFIYSVGIMVLVHLYVNQTISSDSFNFWIVWCYTIPFAAGIFPILLIFCIQRNRTLRTKKITDITHAKQTQEGHINQMKTLWK